ncbi:hypothetical protein ASE28_17600 [Acidovorax sp. Root219]|nr:hypothetical protein ASE28_17600 [Acidovorax sp. Root219]
MDGHISALGDDQSGFVVQVGRQLRDQLGQYIPALWHGRVVLDIILRVKLFHDRGISALEQGCHSLKH